MTRLPFYSNCVDWPTLKLSALEHLIDNGVEVTRDTFRRKVLILQSPPEWYPHAAPFGINYFTLPGLPVYWYTHSMIEFVFAESATIDILVP